MTDNERNLFKANEMLEAVRKQRETALNANVMLQAEIALIKRENDALKAEIERLKQPELAAAE